MRVLKRIVPLLLGCLAAWLGGCQSDRHNGGWLSRMDRADFRRVVQDAKDGVFPAVVFVKCIREGNEEGKRTKDQVSGSGVVISPEGELLTNWHVVDKAVEIRCLLLDGRPFSGRLLGVDKDTDLALVQLEVPADARPLPYAELGDSTTLREGDFVMAMGAPWGLTRSVSIGIISCARRFLVGNSEYSLWLQTDASICPGNSGGPLVNTGGNVVGINTRGSFFGGDMGFAVPSETIRFILPQLRRYGKVQWAWTGIQLQPLKDFNRDIYFDAMDGVMVAGVDPESPAAEAGLRPRDRIVRIGDVAVTAMTDEDIPAVRRRLGALEKGTPIALTVVRGDATLILSLKPCAKSSAEGEEVDCPRWDFTAKAINQFEDPDLFVHRKSGVYVLGVKYPGNAMYSGVAHRDILLKVDGREIQTLDDLRTAHKAALEGLPRKSKVVLTVLRGGLEHQLVLGFAQDYSKDE
ncbi:MAG: hypothetical protein A3K19_02130 [Lentisphaerae bacterium RIFOXYB12_FULL_65_16]|nr:MAG: hypothetical protein A3K18_25350 [Lentisphaerae bacterium RIFOXYA12_64_32]OGV92596.1 MAG: hypothetical protein A3K19_02130 [Lentisphaerae bacterium RIFOXYB12_FULL_65_16]